MHCSVKKKTNDCYKSVVHSGSQDPMCQKLNLRGYEVIIETAKKKNYCSAEQIFLTVLVYCLIWLTFFTKEIAIISF